MPRRDEHFLLDTRLCERPAEAITVPSATHNLLVRQLRGDRERIADEDLLLVL